MSVKHLPQVVTFTGKVLPGRINEASNHREKMFKPIDMFQAF